MRGKPLVAILSGLIGLAWGPVSTAQGAPAKPGSAPATPIPTPFVIQTPEQADPIMGDYEGTLTFDTGQSWKAKAGIVPEGSGAYRAVLTVDRPSQTGEPVEAELRGQLQGGELPLAGLFGGAEVAGQVAGGKLTAEAKGARPGKFEMSHVVRHSPTEGQKPPEGAIVLLPFQENTPPAMDEWTNETWVALPDGSMLVGKGDNLTRKEFGSYNLHVEFCIPYMPTERGQKRGNSGVYMHNRYEVQVLDSYGLPPKDNECGGIYKVATPKVKACFPPLSWQTYDIAFRAPKLSESGELTRPPVITVAHNGQTIHENVTIPAPTQGGKPDHVERGPLKLQDHRNPARYRNIWLVELPGEAPAPPAPAASQP